MAINVSKNAGDVIGFDGIETHAEKVRKRLYIRKDVIV